MRSNHVDYTRNSNTDTTAMNLDHSIHAAMRLIPEGWTRGFISWPGYDNGKLIDEAYVELHHALSSGGGPKVSAYAQTIAEALRNAAAKARELEDSWRTEEQRRAGDA